MAKTDEKKPDENAGPEPPHDLEAERCVLGSLLLDCDEAWPRVEGIVGTGDFYHPSHSVIFEAIEALRERGEQINPVTLSAELRARERLNTIGGLQYIGEITDVIPTTAHAAQYAQLVADHAVRRAMITECQRAMAAAYNCARIDAIAATMSAAAGGASARTTEREPVHVSAMVDDSYTRMTKRESGEIVGGIKFGIESIDALVSPMQPGQLIIIAGRPSMGKAQPIETPVLTPSGFRPIGQLAVGDRIIGSDGKHQRVVGIFPQGKLPVYSVVSSDGASTECCGEHLWFTTTRAESRRGHLGTVRTTSEILRTLVVNGEPTRLNHRLPVVSAVEFDAGPALPISPYALGLLLGDGSSSGNVVLSNPEADIQARFAASLPDGDAMSAVTDGITCRVRTARPNNLESATKTAMRLLGLAGVDSFGKFIPPSYLYASIHDRIELLRGLNDSDGYVIDSGQRVEYTTTSTRLRDDVLALVRSLGGTAHVTERITHFSYNGERRAGAPSSRIVMYFGNGIVPVSSSKHLARWVTGKRGYFRSVAAIEPVGVKECVCIAVSNPDHLYVTSDFLLTHNTALVTGVFIEAALAVNPGLFFSLETKKENLSDRLLAQRSAVDLASIRQVKMDQGQQDRLATAGQELWSMPLWFDDGYSLTIPQMGRIARRHNAKHPEAHIRIMGVDYMQLMKASGKSETREGDVSEISRGLKALAKELDIPIVALSQINRQTEGRTVRDHRPKLADLRESGAIEQDADVVAFVYRDVVYDTSADRFGAEFICAKQKDGPTGTAKMRFVPECARFEDERL